MLYALRVGMQLKLAIALYQAGLKRGGRLRV
jgi:hypothetical protein